MTSFDNQYNFRVDNQLKILFELRNGPLSLQDLANRIGVSFTAISNIVSQLVNENVIVYSQKQKSNKKGRKPSFVKINNKVGVTCAVDLSSDELIVAISDLRNRIIIQKNIKTDYFINESTFDLIVNTIKDLLKDDLVENRPLLSICIAAPGLINKKTGEVVDSFRLKELRNLSLSTYFFNKFGVQTNVYNDVKIGLVGERIFGCIPPDAQNYMFIHLGNGCSFALAFNGKLYQGTNGYSGELSAYKENNLNHLSFTNNHLEGFTQVASRIENKNNKYKLTFSQYLADVDQLIKLFNEHNEYVINAIEESAKYNAVQLIAYYDILDLEYIVISGSILKLGDYYKDLLVKYIKEFNLASFRAKLLFSNLTNPTLLGTIYQANNLYFLRKLEQITNKKAPQIKYDISEAFGINI